jgi:hypothetical protein
MQDTLFVVVMLLCGAEVRQSGKCKTDRTAALWRHCFPEEGTCLVCCLS